MILEFSIENFRSFKKKQTFSMVPDGKKEYAGNVTRITKKLHALKTAVVYGANASGKSNFMRALQTFRNLILLSADNDPGEGIAGYDPFQFSEDARLAPTIFELNFVLGDTRYFYSVSVVSDKVISEQLLFYPQGREAKLFVRRGQHFDFGDYLKGQKAVIADLTAENQLFLSKAAKNNLKQLVDVFLFFSRDFMSIPFLEKWIDSYYVNRIAKELAKSDRETPFYHNFKILLQSFGTGIVNFRIESNKLSPDRDYDIFTEHKLFDRSGKEVGSSFIAIEEESAGTQKLFILAGLILRALMHGRVIMIDEFERSLHPDVSSYILRMFLNPKINTKGAQLIIATHDTNLLRKDNRLSRDQIWIVEKDKYGASELFSLADISGVRQETPFEKWYLSGRLGGTQGIESLNFELNFQHEAE